MITAPQFSFHEFFAIVHNVADKRRRKSAQSGIFFCLRDDSLCGIDMDDMRSGNSGGNGRATRVCKQIEHADGPAGISDQSGKPIPVYRLFREKTGVLEAHRAQQKTQFSVRYLPLLRQFIFDPTAAAGYGASVYAIRMLPRGMHGGTLPDDLRIRTDQDIIPPPFQTFAVRGVQQFIFFPLISNPHF